MRSNTAGGLWAGRSPHLRHKDFGALVGLRLPGPGIHLEAPSRFDPFVADDGTGEEERNVKVVSVPRCPGMTVKEAIAEAWARLELQGYIVLDEPAPTVATRRDGNGRAIGWSIAFPVVESRGPES